MTSDIDLIDEELLRYAASGYSGQQMEQATGVPAATAIIKVKELLKSKDVWDIAERRALLIDDLLRLKDDLQKNLDITDAKHTETLVKLLRVIGERLDQEAKHSGEELDKLTTLQAQKLVSLFIAATQRAKELLREDYPDVVMVDIERALEAGLAFAAVDGTD